MRAAKEDGGAVERQDPEPEVKGAGGLTRKAV